ncbi:Ig domain-containing protein [Butyrivibrio sp. XB500-5]|nr:Ig domain-containing protein [Butyrivibrio sp. XB500-5]
MAMALIILKVPAEAAEPTRINLSELEDDQVLELQENTILNLDTDKRLTKISLTGHDLTIEGSGSLTLGLPGPGYWDNLVSNGTETITINSGVLVAKQLEGNFIVNDGKISIPETGPSLCNYSDNGFFIMNGGEVDVDNLYYPGENSEITINGGYLTLHNIHFLGETKLNISENEYRMSYGLDGIKVLPKSEVTYLEGISFAEPSYTLDRYDYKKLPINFYPESATNKNLTYTSSDPSVVRMYDNGYADIANYGSATITATSEDGDYTATCEIIVPRPNDLPGLSLNYNVDGVNAPQFTAVKYGSLVFEDGQNSQYNFENDVITVTIPNFVDYVLTDNNIAPEDKKELTIQFCEDATKSNHHIKLMFGDTTLTAGEDYFYDIDDNSENGILSVVFPELEYYFENLYNN